jgi:hypothetical protein
MPADEQHPLPVQPAVPILDYATPAPFHKRHRFFLWISLSMLPAMLFAGILTALLDSGRIVFAVLFPWLILATEALASRFRGDSILIVSALTLQFPIYGMVVDVAHTRRKTLIGWLIVLAIHAAGVTLVEMTLGLK